MIEWRHGNPNVEGTYLTTVYFKKTGARHYQVLDWCDGWNCYRNAYGIIDREHELKNIDAYAVINPPEEV